MPPLPNLARTADSLSQTAQADRINIVSIHMQDLDLAHEQRGMFITPVRSDGRIKLIAWRLSEDGQTFDEVTDSGDYGEHVNGIAVVRLSIQRVVTAVRSNQGRLKIMVWRFSSVTGDPTIELLGQSEAADELTIGDNRVSVVTTSGGHVVAVARDIDGRLLLTDWSISADGATIIRKPENDVNGPVVTEFVAVRSAIGRLVIADRSDAGRLQLHKWAVAADAGPVLLGSSDPLTAEDGREISITVGGEIMTAARTAGDLELIRWDASLERLGDSAQQGGPASRTSIHRMTGDVYVTAVRGLAGRLDVEAWQVQPTKDTVIKAAVSAPDDQELTGQLAALSLFGRRVVTAVQDANGRLKVIAWQVPAL